MRQINPNGVQSLCHSLYDDYFVVIKIFDFDFDFDIFQCIFVHETLPIMIQISLQVVCPKRPVDSMSPLVQIMAWHRIGDKALSHSVNDDLVH